MEWLLLLLLVRAYYNRKWHGKRPGDPLDITWIRKRIDCSEIERHGRIAQCRYKDGLYYFLVEGSGFFEIYVYRHSLSGWQKVTG